MKVFLVDDNPVALTMLSHALNNAGYETSTATSGLEALKQIPAERPDVVILDIMMPEMDGFETARQLGANPATRRIPILVLTAKDQVEDKIRGLDAGADDYVVKPITPAELVARVRALIRRTEIYAEAEHGERGQAFTFLGVKGGVGTSTLAVNVALALAQNQKKVILADLNPWASTIDIQLGLRSRSSLITLANKAPHEITQRMVEGCLEHYIGGLEVLAAGHHTAEQIVALSPEQITMLVAHLEAMSDIVVVDAGQGLAPTALKMMQCSQFTALVFEPDAIAVSLLREMLPRLEKAALVDERLNLILIDHHGTNTALAPSEIAERVSHPVRASFAPAAEILRRAARAGEPVLINQPDTTIAGQLREFALSIVQHQTSRVPSMQI
ncbi:MAG: response regulator [Anaerolineae bacterium]|nr:response regulator [Anaerolineae bacterium]